MFLFICLTCVALGSSLQPVRKELLLNRPQTEEWKGWMQVLFLLYHYFEARELYNAIRIFIAGYVWMTGYGNFSYYYRTGDFSIGRWVCAGRLTKRITQQLLTYLLDGVHKRVSNGKPLCEALRSDGGLLGNICSCRIVTCNLV